MIRIGVIGGGAWGANHVRCFSELSDACTLVGLADVDESKKALSEKYKIRYFKDYREMLPFVDAVSIVAPTNLHYELAKFCLQSGKHVIVEKPLTISEKEGATLVRLAEKKNQVLAVGHLYRFCNAVVKLKELLSDAGEIQFISMRHIHSTKPPRKDMGVIFNFGSHMFDTLDFLLDRAPKKIFCEKSNFLSEEREDYAVAMLDYGKFMANVELSWLHPLKKRDVWVICSKKKFYVDMEEQKITCYPIDITLEKTTALPAFEISVDKNEPLKDELRAFVSSASSGKTPVNSGTEGLKAVKLCDLAAKSAELHKEIVVK
ncbi:UDP-N-acetylglucosamine 3-dehydrogenase [uncultured archaeon]|nr:UDP-N-acetylglucosamine 3-dehydrogenase [uncultured archaeon]